MMSGMQYFPTAMSEDKLSGFLSFCLLRQKGVSANKTATPLIKSHIKSIRVLVKFVAFVVT